jgi:hypothetical protein
MEDIIREYLKNNMEVWVDRKTEFGPEEHIIVRIELEGELISESSCCLPDSANQ